mmetsp:Transcript_54559/g.118053  ORF Transcript_54559/g.118053 Transcript_54559/m.118053 type:complete len:181 (-) Transcript_54559:120-662(-)
MLKTLVPGILVIALQNYDIEKAGLVNHCRLCFFFAQGLCLLLCLLLRWRISSAKETGEKVHVPALEQFGHEVKPAAVMTVPEYDVSKWREQVQQLVVGATVCFGIHCKWGFVTPIVMQIVMTPMNMLDSPLAKVYLYRKTAKGELLRPWAHPNPFGLPGVPGSKTAKERKLEAKKNQKKK